MNEEYEQRQFWKDELPVYRAVFEESNPDHGVKNITITNDSWLGAEYNFIKIKK